MAPGPIEQTHRKNSTSYFEDDGTKLRCENGKLFFAEPFPDSTKLDSAGNGNNSRLDYAGIVVLYSTVSVVHTDIFIDPEGVLGAELSAIDEEGNDITEATKHYEVENTYVSSRLAMVDNFSISSGDFESLVL